jgi:L-aspartate oxidase
MHNYDKRLELAPRDVVSHSIVLESRKQNSTDFYLDISYKDSEFLTNRFPMIYKNLLEQGYDLTKEPVPIFPCQHYLMGGIDVDSNSETTLPNLYACGECSHTGVHGSNRLASNSLLEALVFSRKAAENIATKLDTVSESFEEVQFDAHMGNDRIPAGIRTETRKIMQNSYFVIPDKEAAAEGLKRVTEIRNDLLSGKYVVDADYVLAKSIVTVAYIILNEVIQ